MRIQFNDTFKLGEPESTCLWLVDIVAYSKVTHLIAQEELIKNIFNCVYAAVNEVAKIVKSQEDIGKELTSDDATVIWTGDGAIVATKFPFGRHTPLLLTSAFCEHWKDENWSHYQKSMNTQDIPKVHIAAHRGNCRWLQTPTLRSPLFEVSNCFGVDINLLARLANFSSEDGEFIISEEYYNELDVQNQTCVLKLINGKKQHIKFSDLKSGIVEGKSDAVFVFREFLFDC